MRTSNLPHPRFLLLPLCCLLFFISAWSQAPPAQTRILERVNENTLTTLRGNTHPLAQAQFDQGIAPPDLPMSRMLLILKRSDAQESALEALLNAQQDPGSSSYHQWLTPDAFGQQFGPGDTDVQTIAAWLGSHGLQIGGISRGRTVIEFSGTAAQVQQAFHTEIHKFVVNGETHWANASDPQIPSAFVPVIVGINSLHNFYKNPAHHIGGVYSKSRATGEVKSILPAFTLPGAGSCSATGTCYFVGPYDFAKIYNVLPLWNASPAIDGTGQSIAILGRSDIVLQDVRDFRNLFGLPPNDPNFILNGADPGIVSGDETEAALDVEWSGAVATGAKVNLVISGSTETTDGVDLSAVYAVENNVAPVINESFSLCELFLGSAGNSFQNAIRQQASAQGITFVTSTGDEGAAGCDFSTGNPPEPATYGLMVSGLATSPYGVAVGGTDFLNYGPNYTPSSLNAASPYWNTTNDTNHASAIGYIPESTWNDSCTNNIFVVLNYGTTVEAGCNNSRALNWVETVGASGGKSSCISSNGSTASSCTGGYPKPSWQSAPGVPTDGARDIPDVSLFAGNGFFSSAYILCEADQTQTGGTCGLTGDQYDFVAIGGTSASSPAFAGIMALVNQYAQSTGQGNANHVLYKLASSTAQRSANCNSSTSPASGCIFNDVTSGTIATPCAAGSSNCTMSVGSDTYGILSGYSAAAGYDLATGLGSVNAYNLVHNWGTPGISTATALSLNSGNAVNITHGQSVPFNIAVTPNAATGNVSLIGSPTAGSPVALGSFLTLQNGAVSGTTASLAGGTSYQVKAHYAGDSVYAPSDSVPVTVTVAPEPSKTLISIPVFDPTAGRETGDNPATLAYGSPYIERVDVGNLNAALTFPMKPLCADSTCPTGSVTLADSVNGGPQAPLGTTGAFPLNSEGYAEYFAIQLAGGSHQLAASYAGDSSYRSSTGNYALTVTPAPTQMPVPYTSSTIPFIVGNFNYMRATVSATTSFFGAAPTGTISFYDGATPLSGTVTYDGVGGYPGYAANLNATFTPTFVTTGVHEITAIYSGDANYATVTSSALSLPVVFATSMAATANPGTVTYGQNSNVTVTATVSTGQPASNAALKPTGTISFGVTGAVTTTTGQDAAGNWILQGTVMTIPQQSEAVSASYSGDSNYSPSSQWASIVVTIPDFAVNVSSIPFVISGGQTESTTLTITPTTNYTSTVALSCYGIAIAGASCNFSPSSVTLSNGASAVSTLSLTLPAASANLTVMVSPRLRLTGPPTSSDPGFWWTGSGMSIFASLLLLFSPRRRRRTGSILGLTIFGVAAFAIGCGTGSGGVGGSGGGVGGGGGAVATTTGLTATSGKIGPGASATLTAVVKSSNAVTGYVNFFDASFPDVIAPYVNVVNGMAQAPMTNAGSLSADPGTHVITAAYSGDANNQPSQSGGINIVVTGTRAVLVAAQTSVNLHTVEVNVIVQ